MARSCAFAKQPRAALAHYYLGRSLAVQEKYLEASQALEQAIILRPELADAHVQLIEVELSMEDFRTARQTLERAEKKGYLNQVTAQRLRDSFPGSANVEAAETPHARARAKIASRIELANEYLAQQKPDEAKAIFNEFPALAEDLKKLNWVYRVSISF